MTKAERLQDWRKRNPDKVAAANARAYPKMLARMATPEYKARKSEYDKAYRIKLGESYLKRHRDYYAENRERIRAERTSPEGKRKAREYAKNRYQSSISYRLMVNMRNRLHAALEGRAKSGRTMELIGCKHEELIAHLESKFSEGMSWSNYGWGIGKWVVDHIIPCAKFDLSAPDQQKRCFHFLNLQPLWWDENLLKSDRISTGGTALAVQGN